MTNSVSITNYPAIFLGMNTEGVGAYIRRRRGERGLSQKEMADRAGTSSAYLSQIEGGKVGLPGVEIRRGIARVLGESQVEQLIAAGEIDRSEVPGPDVPPSPTDALPPPIRDLLASMDWSDLETVASMTWMLERFTGTGKRRPPTGGREELRNRDVGDE